MLPRNVQKDEEASLTWVLKDELVNRGKVYYAKLARGKATFLAPRMIPYFHAIWGVRKSEEKQRLSKHAQAVLRVLRREWEMATSDLRAESGVKDRSAFTKAVDELQAAMIVVPSEVCYVPKFTYIWTLGIGRFPDALLKRVKREIAVREIARCFLAGAGATLPGEMARVTGLSRPEAGRGNRALVGGGLRDHVSARHVQARRGRSGQLTLSFAHAPAWVDQKGRSSCHWLSRHHSPISRTSRPTRGPLPRARLKQKR